MSLQKKKLLWSNLFIYTVFINLKLPYFFIHFILTHIDGNKYSYFRDFHLFPFSLKALKIIWQHCGSHRALLWPSYSRNVEPQWGLFDWTGIEISAGWSLSISDFNRSVCEKHNGNEGRVRASCFHFSPGGQSGGDVVGRCQPPRAALTGVRTQPEARSHWSPAAFAQVHAGESRCQARGMSKCWDAFQGLNVKL